MYKENYDTFTELQLYQIGIEFVTEKRFDDAWNCVVVFGNRGLNSSASWQRYLELLIFYAKVIIKNGPENFTDKIEFCRNIFLKSQDIIPTLKILSLDTASFIYALAECCYIVGPRSLALQLYLEIATFGGRSTDFYRLAELLLLEARPISEVLKVLQIGIQKDPGKYWINSELEKIISHKSSISISELKDITSTGFKFSNSWFSGVIPIWNKLLPELKPNKILEIGSYEGASTTHLIELLAVNGSELEIHCVDTWDGGEEHKKQGIDFTAVEETFDKNIALAAKDKTNLKIIKHKGYSDSILSKFLALGKRNYFDFIYIDGSHQAADVLCDGVLAFRLLRIGGILAFDDYMFMHGAPHERNIFNCPKPAIDAFINIHFRKIKFLADIGSNYQVYIEKYSD
jgi:hypothetical protein